MCPVWLERVPSQSNPVDSIDRLEGSRCPGSVERAVPNLGQVRDRSRPNPNEKEWSVSGSPGGHRLEGSEVGTRNVHCSIHPKSHKAILMVYDNALCC